MALRPDPSAIGGVAEVPYVRLPDPAMLFAPRARRCEALAPGHVLEPYLRFLGGLARAQAACLAGLPPPDAAARPLRADRGLLPPLGAAELRGPAFAATLAALLDALAAEPAFAAAPAASHAAAQAARGLDRRALDGIGAGLLAGDRPAAHPGEALFAAAAAQVHLARLASRLPADSVPRQDRCRCPACGAPPVASLIVGWTQASKARFCACALCGTEWNYVRIRCTACGGTASITYLGLEGPGAEGAAADVGLEACGACHSYIKHLQQHRATTLDPFADDVASYALDLLAAEEGYRRAGFDPLFPLG